MRRRRIDAGHAAKPVEIRTLDDFGLIGYGAGDDGNIWSRRRLGGSKDLAKEWRRMKASPNGGGYLSLNLNVRRGVNRRFQVHILVSFAFLGRKPAGLVCCHNNGDRFDNRPTNLRYDTQKSNMADQLIHGTRPLGERHHNAKLSDQAVIEIRALWQQGHGLRSLGRRYGVTHVSLLRVVRGTGWAHVRG